MSARRSAVGRPDDGTSACLLHEIRTPQSPRVHVAIPAGRQIRPAEFTVVERTTRLPVPVLTQGLPCTPAPRAVLDAARRLGTLDAVRSLLADAVQQRRCTPAELRGEIDCGSRRGSALPRMVLTEITDGVRSVAEADARVLLAELRGAYQVASQRKRPPLRILRAG